MTMRRFIQSAKLLNEHISDNASVNDMIEDYLLLVPADLREDVLDALDIIQSAGQISKGELVDQFVSLRPESSAEEVLNQLKRFIGAVIDYTDDGFQWAVGDAQSPDRDYPDVDLNTPTGQLAQMQVEITSKMLAKAKELGEFNLGGMARLAMAAGVPGAMAMEMAQHFVDQFPQLMKPQGGGVYHYEPEPKRSDSMSLLRDLANRASKTGRIDGE